MWMTCSYSAAGYSHNGKWKDLATGQSHDFYLSVTAQKNFTPQCKRTSLNCRDTFNLYLMTDYTLTAKVVIPVCKFKISVLFGSSSWDITTSLQGSSIYLECEGNKCLKGKNAGSTFVDEPNTVSYYNTCTTIYNRVKVQSFSETAIKDSVRFDFTPPLSGEGQVYGYLPAYDYKHPFSYYNPSTTTHSSCTGIRLDSTTGEMEFKPMRSGEKTIMAIKATTYRKDSSGIIEVGTTMRCFEMEILTASDETLIFNTTSRNNIVYGYVGIKDTFQFIGMSLNNNIKKIKLELVDTLPSRAKFMTDTSKQMWGSMIWKPTEADVRKFPYHICLRAYDSVCPFPGIIQQTFFLYLLPKPDSFSIKLNNSTQCVNNNRFVISDIANDPAHACKYVYDFGDSMQMTHDSTHTYKKPGKYLISVTAILFGDTLGTRDTTVTVLPSPSKPDFLVYNRKLFCSYAVRNMYFQNKTPYDSATTYFWRFSDGKVSFDHNAIHAFPINPRYGSATLIAKKGTCLDSINYSFRIPQTKTITVSGKYPSYQRTLSCHTYQFHSNLDTTLIDSVTSITWDFGDGSSPVINNMDPLHIFSSPLTHNYSVKRIISDGECMLVDSMSLIDSVINISISGPDSVCAGRTVSFSAAGDVNKIKTKDIKWKFGNGDSASGPVVFYSYLKSGRHNITVSYPDDPCIRTSGKYIFIKAWSYPTISGNVTPSAGRDTTVYHLDQIPSDPHKWSAISGALISKPAADTAAIVWYDTSEYSGKVICDFDTTQCIDRAELIVFPYSTSLSEDGNIGNNFKLYPNPTDGNLTLEYNRVGYNCNVTITDITGKLLYSTQIKDTEQRKDLSISSLPAGVYYLRVSSIKYETVKKIVKL